MITKTDMLYVYVETPLHAGVGSGLSSIDLPIQRERATQYPMIQGSGIKGKLRSIAEDDANLKSLVDIIFGPPAEAGKGSEHAGALAVGDVRLLLFPVRSLSGVFAYTTSYDVLSRFKRDLQRGSTGNSNLWDEPANAGDKALVTTTSEIASNNRVVLEEFSFDAQPDQQVNKIADWIASNALPKLNGGNYWANKLRNSLVILPNDDFRDFVLYATEIITRVKLNRETKTVDRGALWTEEHLPTDTVMYVPLYATDSRKNGKDVPVMKADEILRKVRLLENTQGGYLQLGGDETVGRGMVRIHWPVAESK